MVKQERKPLEKIQRIICSQILSTQEKVLKKNTRPSYKNILKIFYELNTTAKHNLFDIGFETFLDTFPSYLYVLTIS